MSSSAVTQLWPLAVYAASALLVVGALIGVSALVGERHMERDTGQPYESGIVSTRPSGGRVDVQFYLLAMFFVVFDLEAVFIYAWATVVRNMGWPGFAVMTVFIGVLLATLIYLW